MMSIFTQHGILLALNEDAENLINLLITVIIIAIWLAGSMVRTTKGKTKKSSRKKRPSTGQKGGAQTKPSSRTWDLDHQEKEMVKKLADEQRRRRTMISDAIGRPPVIPIPTSTSSEVSTLESIKVDESFGHLDGLERKAESHVPQEETSSDLIPDQWQADDLARAVIYQEILGKPVGLREQTSR